MKRTTAIAAALLCTALFSSPLLAAPAGALDPTFGVGGKLSVRFAGMPYLDHPATVRDSAGRIYLIEQDLLSAGLPIRIARLHHDGALDTSYGVEGFVETAMPLISDDSRLRAAARLDDGSILLAFRTFEACRLRPDGTLDTSFGNPTTPGCTSFPGLIGENDASSGKLQALVAQGDGGAVLIGNQRVEDETRGILARLQPDGTIDNEFGKAGIAITEVGSDLVGTGLFFNDATLAPNGDVVVGGGIDNGNYDFLVGRFDGSDGEPIDSFGDGGFVTVAFDKGGSENDVATAVATLPDGGIIAAGDAVAGLQHPYTIFRPAVVKLKANGAPNEMFGPEGKRIYHPCAGYAFGCQLDIVDVAVLPNEELVVGGRVTPSLDFFNYDFLAMRISANGVPDSSFGNNPDAPGSVVVKFDLEADGTDTLDTISIDGERILLIGIAEEDGEIDGELYETFALARLDHGLPSKFDVTPAHGEGGTLSPSGKQIVRHSDRAEFEVFPDPGYAVHAIGNGPANCGGGMDGNVYVTAPIVKHCIARVTFKPVVQDVFADSFE